MALNRIWTIKSRLRIACVPLFIAGCLLLYYGTTMLFLVPGNPYESYWKSMLKGRFVYGVLPAFAGLILLVIVGWLWDRSKGSPDFVKAIGQVFSLVAGTILLFWVCMIIIWDMRNGFS